MKLNKIFTMAFLGASLIITSCGNESKVADSENASSTEKTDEISVEESNLTVDLNKSSVVWQGSAAGGAKTHEGTINMTSANLMMKGDLLTGGKFVVDMSTIVPTDDNYSTEKGKTAADLVGHLGSGDFFDMANHNNATFEIVSMEGTEIKGNLTVRGTTHEEVVKNVVISEEGENMMITGDLTFDRLKYGVEYGLVTEIFLSNDVVLNIKLTASK